MLAWLSVWSEVQTCIWPSWCHCHTPSFCFSRIQIGFTFLVPAHPASPWQRAVKRVCVCMLFRVLFWLHVCISSCRLLHVNKIAENWYSQAAQGGVLVRKRRFVSFVGRKYLLHVLEFFIFNIRVAFTTSQQPPPLYRSTCISRHLQLRTGGFCWCKVSLPACPCWRQPARSYWGEDAGVLLNSVVCTVSVPLCWFKKSSTKLCMSCSLREIHSGCGTVPGLPCEIRS